MCVLFFSKLKNSAPCSAYKHLNKLFFSHSERREPQRLLFTSSVVPDDEC